jgi:hypothetical protein
MDPDNSTAQVNPPPVDKDTMDDGKPTTSNGVIA